MANVIQIKRGTAAAITSANPTLAAGEPCIETDTGKVKVGDGSTAWTSLRYLVEGVKIDDLTAGDDNTDLNASTSKHGLLPKLDNNAAHFLNGQGSWATPTGGGDVIGPASNTDGYIPQWNGADSKTLKNGVELSTDGTFGDNSDTAIPTEKAVKTYAAACTIDGGIVT